jgi:hypothetical protein
MCRGQKVLNAYFPYMNRLNNNHSSDWLFYIRFAPFLPMNERIMPNRLINTTVTSRTVPGSNYNQAFS